MNLREHFPNIKLYRRPLTVDSIIEKISSLPNIKRQNLDHPALVAKATPIYQYLTKNDLRYVHRNTQYPSHGQPFNWEPESISSPQLWMDNQNYQSKLGLNLPFNPHIGPGNSIHPTPSSQIDEDAREHDISYSLSDPELIREADRAYIEKNIDHFVDPNTQYVDRLFSGVGALGIGAKSKVESLTGQLYPSKSLCLIRSKS